MIHRGKELKLEQSLRDFFRPEELTPSNGVQCRVCHKKAGGSKTLGLRSTPKYAIIHLKRFTSESDKVKCFVRIPLKNFNLDPKINPAQLYELVGIVDHEGTSTNTGHYTATCKRDGRWYHFSDAKVMCSTPAETSMRAYILIYKKQEI